MADKKKMKTTGGAAAKSTTTEATAGRAARGSARKSGRKTAAGASAGASAGAAVRGTARGTAREAAGESIPATAREAVAESARGAVGEFSPTEVSPFATTADAAWGTGTATGGTGGVGVGVRLSALPFFGKLLIRGLAEDGAFLSAAEAALGAALPLVPNATAGLEDGGRIFWLGPSEWLVWTERRAELLSALAAGLAGLHAAAADVSDYYAALRLSGGLAREVLAHGCPLDLDGRVFKPGDCAQTRFRAAAMMIFQADDAPTYDVQTRWSHAEYLRRYLAEVAALCAAARED